MELLVHEGFEGFSVNRLAKVCQVSVATLYIYYQDKNDLIIKIAREQITTMGQAMMKGFDPESSFEEGMRRQWANRYQYLVKNPLVGPFMEQLRSSTYMEEVIGSFINDFKGSMERFYKNAVARGEVAPLPFAVFWSIAFAPLYSLLRFHKEKKTVDGSAFKLTEKVLWQTFDLAMKALKPS